MHSYDNMPGRMPGPGTQKMPTQKPYDKDKPVIGGAIIPFAAGALIGSALHPYPYTYPTYPTYPYPYYSYNYSYYNPYPYPYPY